MATYKVLQDIEAEDKLFGPFTLKQFIFGAITIIMGFIVVRLLMLGIPIFIKLPVVMLFLPPLLLFGFLATPISRDQPSDIWLLARLRFLFKPRTRIWSQDGLSDLVTITAPKIDDHVYTNNLSQNEVKSRLQALANTVDTRGWAVKNVNANMFTQPGYLTDAATSDRLVNPSELPQDTSITDITAADDILDPRNNSTAQNLDRLVQQSTASRKQHAVEQMTQPASAQQPTQDYWFMNQAAAPQVSVPQNFTTFTSQPVVSPGASDAIQAAAPTAEEEMLARKLTLENQQATSHASDHMKVLQPLHDREGNIIRQPVVKSPEPLKQTPSPANNAGQTPSNPVIIGLAQNDDLNVATLARQAKQIDELGDGEVVISLH